MPDIQIRQSIDLLKSLYAADPHKSIGQDAYARARLTGGLATIVEGPSGQHVATDMPKGIGGSASAATPGWYVRAGIASCTATVVALRAAELGIKLSEVEVRVESTSDDRGMLGLDDSIPPGPLSAVMAVRIAAPDSSEETLRALVSWAVAHSPMADALSRAVRLDVAVDVGQQAINLLSGQQRDQGGEGPAATQPGAETPPPPVGRPRA
jgi:uncharacterized OsmC-like protein